jgi:hypothetical protein
LDPIRTVRELLADYFAPRDRHVPLSAPNEEPRQGADVVAFPLAIEDRAWPDKFDMHRPQLGFLYDWRLLELVDEDRCLATKHVVGVHHASETWRLSSRIIGSLDTMAIETIDGAYGLGTPGGGELTAGMLDLVALIVREQGIDAERRLPVGRYAPETRGRWRGEAGPAPSEGPRMTRSGPITLDRIVRRNRDLIELGIATPTEQRAITEDIHGAAGTSCVEWRLIAIRDIRSGAASLHVVGKVHFNPGQWISPPLVGISADERLCATDDGCIGLEQRAAGEPASDGLIAVARALHEWKIGHEFGLDAVTPEEIQRDTS